MVNTYRFVHCAVSRYEPGFINANDSITLQVIKDIFKTQCSNILPRQRNIEIGLLIVDQMGIFAFMN